MSRTERRRDGAGAGAAVRGSPAFWRAVVVGVAAVAAVLFAAGGASAAGREVSALDALARSARSLPPEHEGPTLMPHCDGGGSTEPCEGDDPVLHSEHACQDLLTCC